MEKNSQSAPPILIYDGECTLCTRFAQSLERHQETRHINLAPYQDQEIFNRYPQLSLEQCQIHPHLIQENGEVLVAEQVIEYLIQLYPVVKNFSWLLDKKAGKKTVELFYTAASRLRKNLKKDCPKCGN